MKTVSFDQSDRPLKNDEAGGAKTGMSGPQHQHDTPGEDCSVQMALRDRARFHDLMACVEWTDIYPHLQRALLSRGNALTGDPISVMICLVALDAIGRIVEREAELQGEMA